MPKLFSYNEWIHIEKNTACLLTGSVFCYPS